MSMMINADEQSRAIDERFRLWRAHLDRVGATPLLVLAVTREAAAKVVVETCMGASDDDVLKLLEIAAALLREKIRQNERGG